MHSTMRSKIILANILICLAVCCWLSSTAYAEESINQNDSSAAISTEVVDSDVASGDKGKIDEVETTFKSTVDEKSDSSYQVVSSSNNENVEVPVRASSDIQPQDLSRWESLQQEIDSSSPSATITLSGEYVADCMLNIPAGKNITFVAHDQALIIRSSSYGKAYINIEENGTLTLSENIVFDGKDCAINDNSRCATAIQVYGVLTLNGATIQNEHSLSDSACHNMAPIYASGENAQIYFNSGEILKTRLMSTIGGGSWYTAGAIYLTEGAYGEINGGSINDCYSAVFYYPDSSFTDGKWANYNSAGAMAIDQGCHAVINGGSMSNNFGYAGTILVGHLSDYGVVERGITDPAKLPDCAPSSLEIHGGVMNENVGAEAGAIKVNLTGNVVMDGGEIINNKSYIAGGVCVTDSYTSGTQGIDQTFAKVPYEVWQDKYPVSFEMYGGKINGNHAWSCGGGLLVASNGVSLMGGEICNNVCGDQGGGVYVGSRPYELNVQNAYIGKNIATTNTPIAVNEVYEDDGLGGKRPYKLTLGAGGGVWFCPTGDAQFYAQNGCVFDDNTADIEGDDFHNEELVPTGSYTISLPTRSMLGSKYTWYLDEKDARYGTGSLKTIDNPAGIHTPQSLKSVCESPDPAIDKSCCSLLIMNNKANKGGGIGSNGSATFGKKFKPRSLEIEKTWTDCSPREVVIEVRAAVDQKDYLIEQVVLNEENNFKATITGLPETIANHKIEDVVYLVEKDSDEYDVTVSPIEVVSEDGDEVKLYGVIDNKKKEVPTPEPEPEPEPEPAPEPEPTPEPPAPEPTPTPELEPEPVETLPKTSDATDVVPFAMALVIAGALYELSRRELKK